MTKCPRMVHVIESAAAGSLHYVADICNALGEDWEIWVIYSRRPDTPLDLSSVFDPKVHLIEVPMVRQPNLIKDYKSVLSLRRALQSLMPDLIHVHSSKAGALGRMAALRMSIPVVYTPHLFAFSMDNFGVLSRLAYRVIEQALGRISRSHLLVGSSQEYADAMGLVPKARITYLPNSIAVPDHPEPLICDNVVMTVGRISQMKNPQFALRAFAEVNRELPHTRFIWVGDGEGAAALSDAAQQLGLHLTITGWVAREAVEIWLKQCRVYVQCSVSEGLPLSVLEAMSLARPVVATEIPAHAQLIGDGVNGYLVESSDVMAKRIVQLLTNYQLAERMGVRAWERVTRDYSFPVFLNALRALYDNLIDMNRVLLDL